MTSSAAFVTTLVTVGAMGAALSMSVGCEDESSTEDVEARLATLEERAGELSEEARAELEGVLADLRSQREALQERLGAIEVSSQQAWEDVKAGLDEAWGELDSALESAADRFGGGEESGSGGG
jgi:chromosome segregation ATPase